MQKYLTKLSFIVFLLVGLAGCESNMTTLELETPKLEMVAKGPLFQGANSATATWEFDLKEILGNGEGQVSKARITSIEVTPKETDDLPGLEKMVFEVTSKNTPMTRIGLYEGAISKGKVFALDIAQEQENLTSAFTDGKMTFVGDFDLIDEEYWGNVEFTLLVKFEIEKNN